MNLHQEFIQIIENDKWMIKNLKLVKDLGLKDCWIGAGFVRNKIWDLKHNKTRTQLNDIDVIHFDKNSSSESKDIVIENSLKLINPKIEWSVKNQARMNKRNNHKPYKDCNDSISYWPETATSIAVRLNKNNRIEYIAPYGLEDLFNLIVRPTPKINLETYKNRIIQKRWKTKWNDLIIIN